MQVGPPAQAGGHFLIGMGYQLLLSGQIPLVLFGVGDLGKIVETLLGPGLRRHHKDFGDFPLFRLDAGGPHQNQRFELVAAHRRHFRRHPAAHGGTHQDVILQAQGGDQHLVEVAHIGDGIDPVGPGGAVKAGLGRHIDGVGLGQLLMPGLPAGIAAGPVQEKQRRAGAAGKEFYGNAGHLDGDSGGGGSNGCASGHRPTPCPGRLRGYAALIM